MDTALLRIGPVRMASSKVPSDQEEKALRLAIARQEDTLCALARDRDVAEHELRRLKSQFDSLEKEQSEVRLVAPHPDAVVPATPAEKVDLLNLDRSFGVARTSTRSSGRTRRLGVQGTPPRALTNGCEVFAKSRVYAVASARIKRFCRSPTARYIGPSTGTSNYRRLPIAAGRDMLVSGCRL